MTTFLPAVLSIVLFPLAPELWREGPLTSTTFKIPPAPCRIEDAALSGQLELFRRLKAPALRSRMALELGAVDHAGMFSGLVELLRQERDPFVRDDLLKALVPLQSRRQSQRVDGAVFESLFGSSSPVARCHALLLYLSCGKGASVDRVLSVLGTEHSVFVLERLKPVLTARLGEVSVSRLRELHGQSGKNLALRCFVLELMGMKGDGTLLGTLTRDFSSPTPLIRQQIVSGLGHVSGYGNGLLGKGSSDADPGVRLSVASMVSVDSSREDILVELLSDPSSSVRASAALSLGKGGCASRASVLAEHLSDSDIVVRRAVADGLALLKPDRSVRDQVVSLADSVPSCRRQAVRFFVALADRMASEPIHRWLRSSSDDLLTEECIRALGVLDYKASGSSVASCRSSRNEKVRLAVADVLGILKVPGTYDTLKLLGRDGAADVAGHAAMSMYRIGDVCFRDDYRRFLGSRSETGGDCRAIALRGLTALKYADAKTVRDAQILAKEACIVMPMAGSMPDTDNVRVSCLLYLHEMGALKLAGAEKVFPRLLSELLAMGETSELMSPDFHALVCQVDAWRQGKAMPRKEVEPRRPIFSSSPLE